MREFLGGLENAQILSSEILISLGGSGLVTNCLYFHSFHVSKTKIIIFKVRKLLFTFCVRCSTGTASTYINETH